MGEIRSRTLEGYSWTASRAAETEIQLAGAVMALVLISVILLMIEFYGGVEGRTRETVVLLGDIITGIFIVELSLRWFAASSTGAHWREFWLDWLAVIPVFRPIRALRAVRVLRALRLLRLYRFGLLAHRFAGTFDPRQFEDLLREQVQVFIQASVLTQAQNAYPLPRGRIGITRSPSFSSVPALPSSGVAREQPSMWLRTPPAS
jgi:hypothetical protein